MYPIPANATRIRYLESTGTQYVDTGVVGGSSSGVEIVASSQNVSEYYALFGARTSGTEKSFAAWQRATSTSGRTGFRVDFYGTGSGLSRFAFLTNWDASGSNTFRKAGNQNWLNGVQSDNVAATFACDYPFFLFAVNAAGAAANQFVGRVYSCKIYSGSTLVRSFIPVRVGQTGYLFDRVSGQLFGNAGTGDFALGPDTFSQGVVPTRMMVLGRDRMYDKEIQYLEGTGDQFIDTGYKSCEASNMVFDAMYSGFATSSYSSTMLFGSQTSVGGSAKTALAVWLNSNGQMSFNDLGFDSGWISSPTISDTSRHTFTIENRTLFVDGTSVRSSGSTATFRSTVSVCLLRANTPSGYQSGSNRRMKGRIYSFRVSEGGILRFDGIPVRKGTTGYLYDRVSKQLFGNAGTGSFTLGPDK